MGEQETGAASASRGEEPHSRVPWGGAARGRGRGSRASAPRVRPGAAPPRALGRGLAGRGRSRPSGSAPRVHPGAAPPTLVHHPATSTTANPSPRRGNPATCNLFQSLSCNLPILSWLAATSITTSVSTQCESCNL